MGLVKTFASTTLLGLSTSYLSFRYQQLVGVRIALGAAEAGFFPGVAW